MPTRPVAPWRAADWADEKSVAGAALIGKACDVLHVIGSSATAVTQSEMSRRTGIPRATLYRILAALTARGLVRNDALTQTYARGFRLLEYAQNVWSSPDLVSVAAGELRRLRDMTGETAYLGVLQDGQVLALGGYEGAHSHRSSAQLGALRPVHCTSQGKAMLSALPDAQAQAILARTSLDALTPYTFTDGGRLMAHLRVVAARGYALDDEENVLGTRCVGAAVVDEAGLAIAGISVAGPAFRITSSRAEQLGPELAEAARRISRQLVSTHSEVADRGGTVVPASDKAAFMGAVPAWRPETGRVTWVDRLAPAVHGLDGGATSLADSRQSIDAALPCREGLALAMGGRLVVVARNGTVTRTGRAWPDGLRVLRADPAGGIWAAARDGQDGGTLIGRLDAALGFAPVWTIAGSVSDMAFNRAGRVLYACAPDRSTVFALGVADGKRRVLTRISGASGAPIGLAVDAEDRVWVALHNGWSVVRLDEDGEICHTMALPVPAPTGLAFGGPDLADLFITTARSDVALDILANAPLSGRLLRCQPGVGGNPEPLADVPSR